MPLATATITYDLANLTGEAFSARRTKVWASTNVPDETVIDTAGNEIRLGCGTGTVDDNGAGTIVVWVPGAGSNPASWQTTIHVDYPDRHGRASRAFGPFTITTSANLADMVAEMEVPAEYVSTLISQMEDIRDDQIDISGISTSDTAVQALVLNTGGAGPLTSAALSATYVPYDVSKNHAGADPLLEFATVGAGATLHLLAGVGSTAPYVLGIGVDHDASPTGVHVSVKGDNSIGYGLALETTSGSGAKGFLGQQFSSGQLIRLVAGSAATGTLATLENINGGTGKVITWNTLTTDGEIDSAGNVLLTGATAEYSVQHAATLQNRARVRVNTNATMLDLDHYAGSSLWYGHRLDTSGFSMRLRQVNAASALQAGTYQTLIELNNGNKIGLYGVTPVVRAGAIGSPAADVTALKTAVDAIRNALTNIGITS